jgi:hypothetical protein
VVDKFSYDLSDFDPAMVEFYKTEDGLVGLPFAVFPSFLLSTSIYLTKLVCLSAPRLW